MPPPKAKLHRNTGKLKSIPKVPSTVPRPLVADTVNSSPQSPQAGSSESDRQFELELYWCIQQLENTLNASHVRDNNKKVDETMKLINTLKSANQPLIKKRQIMRTTFGDYRTKMAEEEKTMALNPESVGFDPPKKKAKYHFVKKAAILTGEKDFRFNFANIQLDDGENSDEIVKTNPEVTEKQTSIKEANTGIIEPSDNTFRFNFSVEN